MPATALIGWTGLGVLVAWTLWTCWHSIHGGKLEWLWWMLAAGVVLCFRWPLFWTPHEYNVDESQLIAGALTLRHDPVFWRAVDGHTIGPLAFYPLLPATFGQGVSSFATGRIIGLSATLLALWAASRAVAVLTTPVVARVAALPALAFEAFTTSPDFLFYSSEVAPVLALSVGIYLAARQSIQPTRINLVFLGLLLGAAPWGKMQVGPIAAVVWLAAAWNEFRAGRRTLGLLSGITLAPTFALLGMLWMTGQTEDFAVSFTLNHFTFAAMSLWTMHGNCVELVQYIVTDGTLAFWFAGGIAFLLMAPAFVTTAPERPRRLLVLAFVLSVVALGCVLLTRRPFTHYLRLLELPFVFLTAATLSLVLTANGQGVAPARSLALAAVFLGFALVPQVARRAAGVDEYRAVNQFGVLPEQRLLVETVRRYAAPGESLAVWGWRCSLYVDTGLRQATRHGQTEQQIRTNPWQHYFLRRYYADIVASRPPVFVDAVGPANFAFHDRAKAHEAFGLLRSWVSANYTLVVDTGGTRVYVANERYAARGGS